MPLALFYTPLKHHKTSGFLIFSGGMERDQWHERIKYSEEKFFQKSFSNFSRKDSRGSAIFVKLHAIKNFSKLWLTDFEN